MQQAVFDFRAVHAGQIRPGGGQPSFGLGDWSGSLAAQVAIAHRHRSVDEVAKVVGEIGVVAPDEGIPRHLGVAVERHLAQRDVARAVGAEGRDRVVGVEHVAAALAHPIAARGEHESVDPDLARQLDPGAHQHRRPDDRVKAVDVLADDVQIGGPPLRELVRVIRKAGAGDVVDERVEPDVDDAGLGIPRTVLALRRLAVLGDRERDPPAQGLAADRDVVEALPDERQHLVLAVLRLDPVRMLVVMTEQPLRIGRQAEEPVALRQPLQLDARVVGAMDAGGVLDQVTKRLEAFVRAVPALVRPEVDVTICIRAADHLLRSAAVIGIRRPDETIGGDGERGFGRLEQLDHLVDELARVAAQLLGAHGDVDRVLVGAGQEPGVVALHAVPARDGVGADDFVEGVDARLVVGIGDRGRQVIAGSVGQGVILAGGAGLRAGVRRAAAAGRRRIRSARSGAARASPWSSRGRSQRDDAR